MKADPRVQELQRLLPRCLLYDWVRLGSRLARLLRDRNHPGSHEALLDRLLARARASAATRDWRADHRPVPSYPPALPISARREEILDAIRRHQVVVVAGETGSGKTTQIPKLCLEAGLGVEAKIGCTQPRRVAALSVSRRIAEELHVAWGREVGCKIRFDDRSSPETFIKLMTDGILLAETQGDPLLSEYNAIVLDEAHERSLNIDFLLGHLKGLLQRRDDLKLIITSATIDTEVFSRAFGGAPVIEVSGRMYPVDVAYEPLDAEEEQAGEVTYVDAAVRAAERLLGGGDRGDLLIFMPGERDIRETADALEARWGGRVEVLCLYGRLSAGDQERVFAPSARRRVIVATNIAETSLTLPGIRYVIDSGLARMSRYNPRTRTRRLPIEPISQSSANQRKGRAGRVEDGHCIRLYAEEDFRSRPAFTQPEIQRANLAEVILRMKAFHLGDIETFPFLNPPTPAAIQAGYALLQELGALDADRALTPLGHDLARLPIDPTLGRMLLQSQKEHATRELLIIASGLSIQDPRERPLDQQAAADAAHRRHVHPRSDFLTLLNVWEAVHDEWESLRTQNQRRKFCRAHFLSYTRMREWQDLHAQLWDALGELGTVRLNESNAAYEAVHRSVLTGLLAHVARREERNIYRATGDRRAMLFPGSALFERVERPARSGLRKGSEPPPVRARTHQPGWVVAGELVETTQLYARTVAGIDPRWVVELAPHLCKVSHKNPHWSPEAGRVLVEEITSLSGMELQRRAVGYGPIRPGEAKEIFIRGALVEERLFPPRRAEQPRLPGDRGGAELDEAQDDDERPDLSGIPAPFAFLAHNRRVREKVEHWQTRIRRHDLGDPDAAMYRFYAARLPEISSRDELSRWLGEQKDREILQVRDADLAGGEPLAFDPEAFPDTVTVGGQPVALRYAYAPGEEHDGVTVCLPFTLADAVSPALLEWAVPGLREAKATEWLRALPKSVRTRLLPLAPKAAEIARDFRPTGPSLARDLAVFLRQRYGVEVPPDCWGADVLPPHLKPRIEVLDHDRRTLASARDLATVRKALVEAPARPAAEADEAWRMAVERWERDQLTGWTVDDLPERVTVREGPGLPMYGWLGLQVEGDDVHLRLFRTQSAAHAASRGGWARLVEQSLHKDMAWARRDLRALARLAPSYAGLGTGEDLEESAYRHLRAHVLPAEPPACLTKAAFDAAVREAARRLTGVVAPLVERVRTILEWRAKIQDRLGARPAAPAAKPGTVALNDLSQLGSLVLTEARTARAAATSGTKVSPGGVGPGRLGEAELAGLVGPGFLEATSFEALQHLPRYLKALWLRLERASMNPLKDRERAQRVGRYVEVLKGLTRQEGSEARRREWERLRWMIEEFRVSVFAQELGTAMPVSEKRLEEQIERLRGTP